MKKYKCIVVDDEILAQELLERHVAKIPYLQLVATCSNAIEAKLALEIHHPDILFLDISMPHLSGLELLKMLHNQPATVLTTAFSEHALEGYELDVLDYLLKPIEFERFFKAVSKAVGWIDRGQSAQTTVNIVAAPEAPGHFFVKSDYKIVKIVFQDILYIEALQKYVRIHLPSERVVTLMSMSNLESLLPTGRFFRIHRSFIIQVSKIDSIAGNMVRIGKYEIPISKGSREALLKVLKSNII